MSESGKEGLFFKEKEFGEGMSFSLLLAKMLASGDELTRSLSGSRYFFFFREWRREL